MAGGELDGILEFGERAGSGHEHGGQCGEVIAVNEALRADPSLANSAPQAAGWFFKVRTSDAGEFAELMDQSAYDELLKSA